MYIINGHGWVRADFHCPVTCHETIKIIVINENIPIYTINGYCGVRAEFNYPMTCDETIKNYRLKIYQYI